MRLPTVAASPPGNNKSSTSSSFVAGNNNNNSGSSGGGGGGRSISSGNSVILSLVGFLTGFSLIVALSLGLYDRLSEYRLGGYDDADAAAAQNWESGGWASKQIDVLPAAEILSDSFGFPVAVSPDHSALFVKGPTHEESRLVIGVPLEDVAQRQLRAQLLSDKNHPDNKNMMVIPTTPLMKMTSSYGYNIPLLAMRDGYLPADPLVPLQESGGMFYIHTWHKGVVFSSFETLFMSLLLTENLENTRFIFWMDEDWLKSGDPRKVRLVNRFRHTPNRFVEFRIADVPTLLEEVGGCWKDRPEFTLRKPLIDRTTFTSWTNVVRILFLKLYGGLWLDSDTLSFTNLRMIHEAIPDKLAAGHLSGSVTQKDFKDLNDTNAGNFNNNFLLAAHPDAREALLSLSCDIRIKPINPPRIDYTPEEMAAINFKDAWDWEIVLPPGYKNSTLRVFNKWFWNDGLLRHCSNHLDICPLRKIPLGTVDPTWAWTADLSTTCEKNMFKLGSYSHSYLELLQSVATHGPIVGAKRHWLSVSIDNKIWSMHHRCIQCRTLNARPLGLQLSFEKMMLQQLGSDMRFAVIEPVSWMTPIQPPPAPSSILPRNTLTIIVRSPSEHFTFRNALRHKIKDVNKRLQMFDGGEIKIFFAVGIPWPSDEENGFTTPMQREVAAIVEENVVYNDMLIVGPLKSESSRKHKLGLKFGEEPSLINSGPRPMSQVAESYSKFWGLPTTYTSDGVLPEILELAAMKWTEGHDSSHVLFMVDDAIHFRRKSLESLVAKLSSLRSLGRGDVGKSDAFIMTIPRDASTETKQNFDVASAESSSLKIVETPLGPVPATAIGEWRKPLGRRRNFNLGILASRELLPTLLSSSNPTRTFFTYGECVKARAANESLLLARSSNRNCHQKEDIPEHPMITRIPMLSELSQPFSIDPEDPTMLKVIDGSAIGFGSMHFGHVAGLLHKVYPEYGSTRSEKSKCLNMFKEKRVDKNKPLALLDRGITIDKILSVTRDALVISSVSCPSSHPLLSLFTS